GPARVGQHDAERVPRARSERGAGRDAPEQRLGLLERAGALGLEPAEEERPLLALGRGGGQVRMGGEEGGDEELLVEPFLRGQQRLEGRTLRGARARGRGAQGAERDRVQLRGLQGLPEGERVGGARIGRTRDGEQLRRGPAAGAGQRAEGNREEGEPPHSSTPKPRYTPTTCRVSLPPSFTFARARLTSLLRS